MAAVWCGERSKVWVHGYEIRTLIAECVLFGGVGEHG